MIRNSKEYCDYVCAEDEEDAKRNLYKYTDCGAWVEFLEDGIKLGSIVEGCDEGTDTHTLFYPFLETDYDETIQEIEKQADLIWDWANVERENGKTDAENGLDWPLL
jgi:hypothetical protein